MNLAAYTVARHAYDNACVASSEGKATRQDVARAKAEAQIVWDEWGETDIDGRQRFAEESDASYR